MHATLLGSRRTSSQATERASLLVTGVVLVCVAKLLRALILFHEGGGAEPLALLPLFLGYDLVDAGLVAFVGALASRALSTRAYQRGVHVGMSAWALLCAADVMSYRLTGTGITWQRLRGDEGSTLSDLGLLSRVDLWVGVLCVVGLIALYPACRFVVGRWRWLRAFGAPWAVVCLLIGGGLLMAAEHHRRLDRWELRHSTLQLFFGSLVEREGQDLAASVKLGAVDWARLRTPSERTSSHEPIPRADATPRNVIVVLMEGVPYRYTSWGAAGFDSTHHLRRRAETEGQLFRRFYSHYHSSIQSIFSLVCSAYPPMYVREGNIVSQAPRIDCGEFSEQMQASGRKTGLFHGGRFAYYDKLSLLGGRGYDVTVDAEHLRQRYPARSMHKWGIDDRAVVDGTLDWIDTLPQGQPFAALLIPITAHYPYWLPQDVTPRFPGDGKPARFASAVSYLDETIEGLLRELEARALYEDTLVVVLADHGERVDTLAHKYGGFRVFYEQNLHVPMLLLNPRLFPAGERVRVSDRLGGIVDVVPTVLDALRLQPDPRHFGQSLLADDFEERRVFFGSFSARETAVGFLEKTHKFAVRLGDRDLSLYDLRADPDELHDLSASLPARSQAFLDDALQFYRANQLYFLEAPTLPNAVSVHDQVLDQANLRVIEADGNHVLCARSDPEGIVRCTGSPSAAFMQLTRLRVDRNFSRCVELVLPPPGAKAELTLKPPLAPRISGLRVGVPDGLRTAAGVGVEVIIDGERVANTRLAEGPRGSRWLQFRSPTTSLVVRAHRQTSESAQQLCLLFGDEEWRSVEEPEELSAAGLERRY